MRRVFWDTMIFAYWFENNAQFGSRVRQIYASMKQRNDTLYTSSYVLGEVLVKSHKDKDQERVDVVVDFFTSDWVTLVDYLPEAARIFAMLRADHGVKALDALHLAIAAAAKVDLFLTNDHDLHKIAAPGLPFIAALESDLF